MTHRIEIPGWLPTRTNTLQRMHWAKRNRVVKADKSMVIAAAIMSEIPKAKGKRRVQLIVQLGPGQRGGDVDAYHKNVLDGLVCCGRLVNDSHKWCEMMPNRYERTGRQGLVILLEDLEDGRSEHGNAGGTDGAA